MNNLQPQVDGPLKVSGAVEIITAEGELLERTDEVWLCRCGRSSSKPYCDGSHKAAHFCDSGKVPADYHCKSADPGVNGKVLRLSLRPNGPIRCQGEMNISEPTGRDAWRGTQASLCRCGESKNKPFCDGSHRDNGFTD